MPLWEARLGGCSFVLLLTCQCQHRWRSCGDLRGNFTLGISQHGHRGARRSKQPAHPHALTSIDFLGG